MPTKSVVFNFDLGRQLQAGSSPPPLQFYLLLFHLNVCLSTVSTVTLTVNMLVLVSLADAFNDAVLTLHVIYCYRQNNNYISPE